jgi:CRISPR-associated protein Csm2
MQQPNKSGYQGGSSKAKDPKAEEYFAQNLKFNSQWIKDKADKLLVSFAEDAGGYMARNGLTKSKIRSIYGEIKRIQMGTFEQEKSSFYLLKPKVAYALGRDSKNEGLKLFKKIFDLCYDSVENEKTYKNFCNVIEAILAYHKANDGKD